MDFFRARRRRLVPIVGTLWASAVLAGIGWMVAYMNAPGDGGSPGPSWPEETRILRDPGRFTLVLMAHPRCPCTRASLGELARLFARAGGRLSAAVVFYEPEGAGPEWRDTALWRIARAIRGAQVFPDPGGVEAATFGAATSGHVLLYDAAGRLAFSGGLTTARGEAGDSAGRSAVLAVLSGREAARRDSFVFGCSLMGASAAGEARAAR